MGHERQMRQFLNQLDQYLQSLDAVDRSTIIQELKSQLEKSLQDNPESELADILRDLGEASQVANRYLVQYGKKTRARTKPFNFWRMLFYGWLGSVAIFLVWLTFMVLKFSPVFKVDQDKNQLVILGGLIEIDGEQGKYKSLDNYHFGKSQYQNHFDGSLNVRGKDTFELIFTSGRQYFKSSITDEISWNCRLEQAPSDSPITEDHRGIEIDFSNFQGSDCEYSIPANFNVIVRGINGSIYLDKPIFDTDIEIDNGEVLLKKAPEEFYDLDIDLEKGSNTLIDDNSGNIIKVIMKNGVIKKF